MLGVATEHECRCTTLPAGWPRCGRLTTDAWSPECDIRTLDRALGRLGFRTREDFIAWVADFGRGL